MCGSTRGWNGLLSKPKLRQDVIHLCLDMGAGGIALLQLLHTYVRQHTLQVITDRVQLSVSRWIELFERVAVGKCLLECFSMQATASDFD